MWILDLFDPNIERLKSKRNIKGLIKALAHKKKSYIQVSAAKALGELGDATAVIPLGAALNGKDFSVRASAMRALGEIGDATAIDPLLTAMQDPYPPIREEAISALIKIGGPDVIPGLIRAMEDGNDDVRERAASGLVEIGDSRAKSALIAALKDTSSEVRNNAAAALGRIGGSDVVEHLIAALKDDDKGVQMAAIYALETIGDARAVLPIVAALKSENRFVRQRAVSFLKKIDGSGAKIPLVAALKDQNSYTRESAAEALAQIGWKPYSDGDKINYYIATKQWDKLAKMGRQATESLIPLLKDPDVYVREDVADALGEIGDPSTTEALISALRDKNDFFRCKVVKALCQMGNSKPVRSALLATLKTERGSEMRKTAMAGLAKFKVGKSVKALIPLIKDRDWRVSESAIRALGEIGDKRAVEPILNYLAGHIHRRIWLDEDYKNLFGNYTDIISNCFNRDPQIAEAAIKKLSTIETDISNNLLHVMKMVEDVVVVDNPATGTISFHKVRVLAEKKLEKRGNPEYDPYIYLAEEAWTSYPSDSEPCR